MVVCGVATPPLFASWVGRWNHASGSAPAARDFPHARVHPAALALAASTRITAQDQCIPGGPGPDPRSVPSDPATPLIGGSGSRARASGVRAVHYAARVEGTARTGGNSGSGTEAGAAGGRRAAGRAAYHRRTMGRGFHQGRSRRADEPLRRRRADVGDFVVADPQGRARDPAVLRAAPEGVPGDAHHAPRDESPPVRRRGHQLRAPTRCAAWPPTGKSSSRPRGSP